jgi:hypothetical protein
MPKITYEARIRAEAIQKFAEELMARSETEFYHDDVTGHTYIYRTIDVDDIDDLVAEMLGDDPREGGADKWQNTPQQT